MRVDNRYRYIGHAGKAGYTDITWEYGGANNGGITHPMVVGSNNQPGEFAFFGFGSNYYTSTFISTLRVQASGSANVTPTYLDFDNSSGDAAGHSFFLFNQGASPSANSVTLVNYFGGAYITGYARISGLVGNVSMANSLTGNTTTINFANSGNGYDASIQVGKGQLIILITSQRYLSGGGALGSNNMIEDFNGLDPNLGFSLYHYYADNSGTFTTNLYTPIQSQQTVFRLFNVVDER